MSNVDECVERILSISAMIRDLDLEAEPLRNHLAQIEVRRAGLKADIAALIGDGNVPTKASPYRFTPQATG